MPSHDRNPPKPATVVHHGDSDAESEFLTSVFSELDTLKKHVSNANWDYEGADPLSERVFKHAEKFTRLIATSGVSQPEIDATPQGEIVFSWDGEDIRGMFDVLILPSGRIAIAGMFDDLTLTGNLEMAQPDIERIIDIAGWTQSRKTT